MSKQKKQSFKKKLWPIIVALVFILVAIVTTVILVHQNIINSEDTQAATSDVIPNDYIAVFHGGVGEVTYETYIYKDDNGHANYGFSYINTESHTKSYGSPDWVTKITGHGSFDWTDGAFSVAHKNNAYSYVTRPGSDETYTIEEFQSMFLMN